MKKILWILLIIASLGGGLAFSTACSSSSNSASPPVSIPAPVAGLSTNVIQSVTNGIDSALQAAAGVSTNLSTGRGLMRTMDDEEEDPSEEEDLGDVPYSCSTLDEDGNVVDAETDPELVHTVLCGGVCNEDGTGGIIATYTLDEENSGTVVFAFAGCQLDDCDSSDTIDGSGTVTVGTECSTAWNMTVGTSSGDVYAFDVEINYADEGDLCGEATCADYSGTVSVNGTEYDADAICEAEDNECE